MLSEGYELLCSLNDAGFDILTTHPDIKKPGKNPGYRVGLGSDGLPQIVEEVDRESMGRLWYHRDGKQNAFPVVKIQHALFLVQNDDPLRKQFDGLRKKDQNQRLILLKEIVSNLNFQLPEKDEQGWERLRDKARKWFSMLAEPDERHLALHHMLHRFLAPNVSTADFLSRLGQLIIQRLEQGQLRDLALAENLLLGIPDKSNSKKPAKAEVPIVLDVAEQDFPISVADPRMGVYIGNLLSISDKRESDGVCAFQGDLRPLLKRRFPEPNLGALGETKLFSKYNATPCEFRYLKKPADWEDMSRSFPISQQLAADIANGFSTLTATTLKGKTWRMVANGKWEGRGHNKREKKDLLLIYCEGQPVISDEAADAFGSDDREKRNQFESDAKSLCRALEGIIHQRPQSRLHVLLIGKVDKEKKQVLMHMILAPQEMLDAAERWQRGVRDNLPIVVFPILSKEKDRKDIEDRPLPPYPDRVVRLLASEWIRGGVEEQKLEGPTLRQVLDLMLRSPGKWEQTAEDLLQLTIQRIGPLLLGIAAAFHSKVKERMAKFASPAREATLRAVALLGIMLDALGRRKEAYMNETAFQLGRLLSLADTLHREYCLYVRKGSIPSQLIGNALMPVAADNPEDAIDRLGERINIYLAWAKKVSGEEYRLTKWVLGQMGEICNAIRRPLPTKTDQAFRAELLLGYLARASKENE